MTTNNQPLCILVVDDSESYGDLVAESLASPHFEIHRAADGALALEYMLAQPREWFAVITDLRMPRLDGMGLIRQSMAKNLLVSRYVLMSSHFEQDAKMVHFLEDTKTTDLHLVEKAEYARLRGILALAPGARSLSVVHS